MANTQTVSTFKMPTPYDQQIEELKRRQQMAEMLQQQAMQPLESQVAPGGMVVPTSPVLGLAKLLQNYMGGKQLRDIEKQRGEREQLESNKAMNFLKDIRMGQQQPMSADDALGASLSATPTEPQRVPMSAMDKQGAMDAAMLGGSPQMRMAAQLAAMKPERNMKIADLSPKDFTPESWKAASRADDPSLLVGFAPKPEKLPSAIEEYNFAKDQGFKGSFLEFQTQLRTAGATNVNNFGAPVSGVDEQGNPVFFQPSKEGGKPAIIPGVRPEAKPPTDEQAKAAGFAKRLELSNKLINENLFTPTIGNQLGAQMPFSVAFLSDAQQKYNQAKLEFITAQLRRESGAVIGKSEFDDADKQYFPQPGNSKELLQQKAKSRALAIQNMRDSAGPGFKAAMPSWLPGVQSALDKYAPQGGR